MTDEGGDWWQRYTLVGVSPDFPDADGADEIIMSGTVDALLKIVPEQAALIRDSGRLVRAHGPDMRFLLKRKETKQRTIDVAFSIAAWPKPSQLHVSITDNISGAYSEAPAKAMSFYTDGFDLVGSIVATETAITISPKKSFTARMASEKRGGPLALPMTMFVPASLPPTSKLVSR